MAFNKNFKSRSGYLKVESGQKEDGTTVYKNKTIGKMNQTVDPAKVCAVMEKIGNALASNNDGSVNATATYSVEEQA